MLIDFLNLILPPEHQIEYLEFITPEKRPSVKEKRIAIFDIHCRSTKGVWFIVEMQNGKITNFIDRALYYTTFPIQEQAKKGKWDYKLEPVYLIAFLNFRFSPDKISQNFRTDVALKDQNGKVFCDKLNFCFIEMPIFNKKESELATHFDKWMFFLKNLESFDHIPAILNEPIFKKAFAAARLANLNPEELKEYRNSEKIYTDMYNVVKTAKAEGEVRGEIRGEI